MQRWRETEFLKRTMMCSIHVPTAQDECKLYVLQTRTNTDTNFLKIVSLGNLYCGYRSINCYFYFFSTILLYFLHFLPSFGFFKFLYSNFFSFSLEVHSLNFFCISSNTYTSISMLIVYLTIQFIV